MSLSENCTDLRGQLVRLFYFNGPAYSLHVEITVLHSRICPADLWYSTFFFFFGSHIPRCNFSSTFYPHSSRVSQAIHCL
jgi:hypothetical protein